MRDLKFLDPAKAALVLIDLQKGYCDPASDAAQRLGWDVTGAEEICKRHVPFLAEIRKILPASRILWVRMQESAETYAPNTPYGPDAPIKSPKDEFVELCKYGTTGHQYHIVEPAYGEKEFNKFHPSAFSSPSFTRYLQRNHITQLVFTGGIISRCLNATIHPASALGYDCLMVQGLLYAPKHLHAEATEHFNVLSAFHARVVTPKEVLVQLRLGPDTPTKTRLKDRGLPARVL
jgi:nicotinamidase-related amidase